MKSETKYFLVVAVVILAIGIVFGFIFVAKNFGSGSADYTYRINSQCLMSRSSAHRNIVTCDGIQNGISPDVFSIGWNDNFLVAKNHPFPDTDENSEYRAPNESISHWWIVDLKNKKEYGPLKSEAEFNKQKGDLGIGNIELWTVDQAKSKGTWISGDFRN